jgi:hypothetical protein
MNRYPVAFHGPRIATYLVVYTRPNASVGSMSHTRALAHWSHAYYTANGYTDARIERTEFCPMPGCDGYGNVSTRKRRSHAGVQTPCKSHVEPVTTIEPYDAATARAYAPGAVAASARNLRERIEMALHNSIPVALLWPELNLELIDDLTAVCDDEACHDSTCDGGHDDHGPGNPE